MISKLKKKKSDWDNAFESQSVTICSHKKKIQLFKSALLQLLKYKRSANKKKKKPHTDNVAVRSSAERTK